MKQNLERGGFLEYYKQTASDLQRNQGREINPSIQAGGRNVSGRSHSPKGSPRETPSSGSTVANMDLR